MGRLVLLLGAGLLALLFAMMALPDRGGDAPSSPDGSELDGAESPLRSATSPERRGSQAGDDRDLEVSGVSDEVEPTADVEFDPTARAVLSLEVVDEQGGPVADAVVAVLGFREAGVGAFFEGRDDVAATVTTDHVGRARLEHLVSARRGGRIDALDLSIRHPDHAPWRERAFPVGEGRRRVTLASGASVAVVGWIGRPEQRVTELEIRVEPGAGVEPGDWSRDRRGRLACNWLEPGPHCLVASHVDAEGRRWTSEGHRFDVLPNGFHVLELELFAPERLTCVLAEDVPRPVRGGHAQLLVSAAEVDGAEPTLVTSFETPVAEDGTFRFDGLPRGHAALHVLADGWASVPASHERWPVGASVELPQRVDPHVVAMEPAGSLTVTVVDPFGVPLPDAEVVLSPGFLSLGAGGQRLTGRPWRVATDDQGRATFPSVPATNALPLAVLHPAYGLPRVDDEAGPTVRLRAGQRATKRLELVTKGR